MTDSSSLAAQERATRHGREIALMFIALVLVVFGGIFLYYIGQYALVGRHPFEFFADSKTYHDLYSGYLVMQEGLIGVSFNFLGPMMILSATQGNIYLIMIVNVTIFALSILFVSRSLNFDPVKVAFIQLLSPMTLSSLMSVNKEIIVFPVLVLIINGYRYRSISLVLAAVLISVLARWQLTVFCLVLIGLFFVRHVNRYLVLALLLIAVSAAYYFMQDLLRPILENVEFSTAQFTEGSGLFERLNQIQNDGFYFLVAIVKAAHLLFSLGLKFDTIRNPIIFYNDQVVATFCLVNLVFFIALIATRRFRLSNDLIMISIVYLVVFALTPVYAPRYFYAVTILWALALAGAKAGVSPTQHPRFALAGDAK